VNASTGAFTLGCFVMISTLYHLASFSMMFLSWAIAVMALDQLRREVTDQLLSGGRFCCHVSCSLALIH
jgi:hypothetical protein